MGIYLDAGSPIAARRLDVTTSTPGFTATVYAARSGPPKNIDDWTVVSLPTKFGQEQKVPLRTRGTQFRYYLLWITELDGKVAIKEFVLRR